MKTPADIDPLDIVLEDIRAWRTWFCVDWPRNCENLRLLS